MKKPPINDRNALRFAQRVLALRKKTRKQTFPIARVNRSLNRKYVSVMEYLVKDLHALIADELMPVMNKIDKVPAKSHVQIINAAFDRINLNSVAMIVLAQERAKKLILKMDYNNESKFVKAMKDTIGIEIADVVKSDAVQAQIQIMTEENFNLIKSIPENELSKIKTMVLQDLSQGKFDSVEIKKMLMKQFSITENRAEFIARDQAHKVNASLSRIRSEALGVKEYRWRNLNDGRVRGNPAGLYPNSKYNHWDREGKIFSYDSPPPDGNPGMPIRCRCYAEGIIPELYK